MHDLHSIARLLEDPGSTAALCAEADRVRREALGREVHLRAIIEFSNHCRGTCCYCGINRANRALRRYRLGWDEVFVAAQRAGAAGFRTVVLQSGEDPDLDEDGLLDTVGRIKSELGQAVTLSCGEWSRAAYRRWRAAGADRYLLKLETTDPGLYQALHPGMSLERRRRCLDDLFELEYEVGTGDIVGLPGQTAKQLAQDIVEFCSAPYDMIAIGPLVPAEGTALAKAARPPADLVLRAVALARINAPLAHIPSTTALCAVDPAARSAALAGGADVLMINFTPAAAAKDYGIYPRAECGSTQSCIDCLGRTLDDLGLRVAADAGSGLRSGKGA